MAEQRKKTDSILLRTGGKIINMELFASSEWAEQTERQDLFRIRINDVWHCPTGKYSFFTLQAIGQLVATILNNGELPLAEPAPHLPAKADVRVYLGEDCLPQSGKVSVAPYQKCDGRWYVGVWVFGKGQLELCCDDVTLIRTRG